MMDDINKVLENTIKAAVVASMASVKDDMLAKLVDNVLSKEVNQNGGTEIRYSDQKFKYIDYLFNEGIKRIIDEAVREYLSENKEDLKVKVKSKLSEKDGFVDKLTSSLNETLEADWNLKVNIGTIEQNRY